MALRSWNGHRTVADAHADEDLNRSTNTVVTRAYFDSLVRDAVEHIYDRASLQGHPLGLLLGQGGEEASDTLQRLVVEIVEQLRPAAASSRQSPEWRRYLYVRKRYIEGTALDQIWDDLAIGERQSRRYNHEALRYVSGVLWARYNRRASDRWQSDSIIRRPGEDEALAAEVANVSSLTYTEVTSFADTLNSVLATVEALMKSQRITLDVALPGTLPSVAVPRVILRQILLGSLVHLGERYPGASVTLIASGMAEALQIRISVRSSRPGQSGRGDASNERDRSAGQTFGTIGRLIELQNGSLVVGENGDDGVDLQMTLPATPLVTVLVIDDNLDFRRLFQRFLEGSPYGARFAEARDDLAQLSRDPRPGVIILDVMMPTLDGWEVLHALKSRSETRQIPVIVCSVLNEPTLARSLGASDVLVKPITRQELLAALDRHLSAAGARASQGFVGDRP